MAKTTFGPGVIVTSKFLNGAQQIYFDGLDLDWHYAPLTLNDIQRGGVLGFDTGYVTVDTDQVCGQTPVTGDKSFLGQIEFGCELQNSALAPQSYNTNVKFNQGGETQTFSVKYANLSDADLITKEVLNEQVTNFPIIDQGFF